MKGRGPATARRRLLGALAIRLVLCLALGALTTVAVAWSLAVLVDVRAYPERYRHVRFEDGRVTALFKGWNIRWREGRGALRLRVDAEQHRPPGHPLPWPYEQRLRTVPPLHRELRQPGVMEAAREDRIGEYIADSRGWPWPALGCVWPWHPLKAEATPGVSWGVPIGRYTPLPAPPPRPARTSPRFPSGSPSPAPPPPSPSASDELKAIPLRPLWPGFVLCTALYALLWSLPITGPLAWTLARRWRAGACLVCGYSRVGLQPTSPCPECGSTPRRAASRV